MEQSANALSFMCFAEGRSREPTDATFMDEQ
jgi:hypothetical protein